MTHSSSIIDLSTNLVPQNSIELEFFGFFFIYFVRTWFGVVKIIILALFKIFFDGFNRYSH
jgi:hypothetical protein